MQSAQLTGFIPAVSAAALDQHSGEDEEKRGPLVKGAIRLCKESIYTYFCLV